MVSDDLPELGGLDGIARRCIADAARILGGDFRHLSGPGVAGEEPGARLDLGAGDLQQIFEIALLGGRLVDHFEELAGILLVRRVLGDDVEGAAGDGGMGRGRHEIEADLRQKIRIGVGDLGDDPGAVDHEGGLAFGEQRARRVASRPLGRKLLVEEALDQADRLDVDRVIGGDGAIGLRPVRAHADHPLHGDDVGEQRVGSVGEGIAPLAGLLLHGLGGGDEFLDRGRDADAGLVQELLVVDERLRAHGQRHAVGLAVDHREADGGQDAVLEAAAGDAGIERLQYLGIDHRRNHVGKGRHEVGHVTGGDLRGDGLLVAGVGDEGRLDLDVRVGGLEGRNAVLVPRTDPTLFPHPARILEGIGFLCRGSGGKRQYRDGGCEKCFHVPPAHVT